MSRPSMRQAVATTASLALIAAGVTVGIGTGIASAAPACQQTSNASKNNPSTVWITHNYSKTVTEKEVAAGTEVTYKTVVGTTSIGNPYVNTITDYPPAGFGAPVSASVTAYHAIGGQKSEAVTPVANGTGYSVRSTGWFVNSGNPVTLDITYKVPAGVNVGDTITSGGIGVAGTVGIEEWLPNLNACFTVRAKNAGESATGSLDGAGLGSSDGQMSSTGSISDVLGDTISRILANGS